MPTLTSGNGQFTPSTSTSNWNWDANQIVGGFGKAVAIAWGGSATTSTGYRTRWYRPTANESGTFTALTAAYHQPNYATFTTRVGTWTQAGTAPADPAGNLFATDWNSQGGVGMIVMPLANPWWNVSGVLQGQVSCRNTKGTDASLSSYEITVEE
jgi:hypothetical protein